MFLGSPVHLLNAQASSEQPETYDVVVYGGSSGGVTASVQAARMGKSVALVSPREHLGGLSSSGLGATDTGYTATIGGLSREFYQRVKQQYDNESNWSYQKPNQYDHYNPGSDAIWRFEPHVAESVFDTMVEEAGVHVIRGERLDRQNGVLVEQGRIKTIKTLDGRVIRAEMFIDATYVGDLMAAAGVSYTVGRESNDRYDETHNGVQKDVRHHPHFFYENISPYREPGNPESGLVPRVHGGEPGENGDGDQRVQAYCFRLCMTKVDSNKVEWPKPEEYDPNQYELLFRAFENNAFKGGNDLHQTLFIKMMPDRKTDTNNMGPFSTDNIGMNYEFPEGSYEKRREIHRAHERYQKGLLWTQSSATGPFVGLRYLHDQRANKGEKRATFSTELDPGKYTVRLSYSAHDNRADNVPVTIHHTGGTDTVHVNQKQPPEHDELFTTLGTFSFSGTARVEIRTGNTSGYVIADAVQFLPKE